MTDSSALGLGNDVAAARALVAGARVAAVPGLSFYSRPDLGATRLPFSFCKRPETLREAGRRLAGWADSGSVPSRRQP
jgi:N-succinyldiaminopimelate aminotransferase